MERQDGYTDWCVGSPIFGDRPVPDVDRKATELGTCAIICNHPQPIADAPALGASDGRCVWMRDPNDGNARPKVGIGGPSLGLATGYYQLTIIILVYIIEMFECKYTSYTTLQLPRRDSTRLRVFIPRSREPRHTQQTGVRVHPPCKPSCSIAGTFVVRGTSSELPIHPRYLADCVLLRTVSSATPHLTSSHPILSVDPFILNISDFPHNITPGP